MTKTFKILSAISFIALALALTFVGVWALTDLDFTVGGDITYKVPIIVEDPADYPTLVFAVTDAEAKTCSVTQNTSNKPTGDVEIPAYVEIDGETYAVTSLLGGYDSSLGFGYNSKITSVSLPRTMEAVGDYAFYYCSSLTNVYIRSEIIIGINVFSGCENLNYNVHENVNYLGTETNPYYYLIGADSSITNCVVHRDCRVIGLRAFQGTQLEKITISKNAKFAESDISDGGVFLNVNTLKEVVIESKILTIPEQTFAGCTSLTSITIPDSVTSIKDYAFYNCSSLTTITIPDSVTSIGTSTFSGCTGLTNVTIGNGVTSIGNSAFQSCTGLTSISVDSGNSIYDSRNNCNAIIETATNTLIYGCKNATIPDSVTSIGSYAFRDCTSLTSITIADSVTSIGSSAFSGCTGLTSITIPDSVTSIGYKAFYGCTGLTNATIGSGVTSIGGSVFYGCSKLATVNVKATSVPTGGSNMFQSCSSSLVIYVPTASVSAYKAATNWSAYSSKIQGKDF